MKQLVSILIPALNAEKWIQGCIESALGQTWSNKEIIVIDDGSKDSTFKVAKSYASPIVKVASQKNKGASAARNHGLSLAQGDYIQWLDADDLLAPNKIEAQLKDAEPGETSMILLSAAWGKFFHLPERSIFTPNALWENLDPLEWLYRKLDGNLWMAIESWLVSRKLTDLAGPWNEELSLDDDGEYFCRVIKNSSGVKFFPNAMCFCRRSTFGLSHDFTLNDSKLNSLATSLFNYVYTIVSIENSDRTRGSCIKLLNRWSIYFYPERLDLFDQIRSMADNLGGKIDQPRLRWKYRWIQKIFGWRVAKNAQQKIPAIRSILKLFLERILF